VKLLGETVVSIQGGASAVAGRPWHMSMRVVTYLPS
jgi:hypothetical protein